MHGTPSLDFQLDCFALPPSFPQGDLIVLTAFAVVLATLILQRLTLAPLVRWLELDGEDGLSKELTAARADLAGAALTTALSIGSTSLNQYGLAAIRRKREVLEDLRLKQRIGDDALYHSPEGSRF